MTDGRVARRESSVPTLARPLWRRRGEADGLALVHPDRAWVSQGLPTATTATKVHLLKSLRQPVETSTLHIVGEFPKQVYSAPPSELDCPDAPKSSPSSFERARGVGGGTWEPTRVSERLDGLKRPRSEIFHVSLHCVSDPKRSLGPRGRLYQKENVGASVLSRKDHTYSHFPWLLYGPKTPHLIKEIKLFFGSKTPFFSSRVNSLYDRMC